MFPFIRQVLPGASLPERTPGNFTRIQNLRIERTSKYVGMFTACLSDVAVIRIDPNTLIEGYVEMISSRGINLRIPTGVIFAKWCNVLWIDKENR